MEHVFVSLTWERAELLNLGLQCWLSPEFLANSNQSSDRRDDAVLYPKENYWVWGVPSEWALRSDGFLFQSSLLPTTFVTLDEGVYKLFEPQAELNGILQAEGTSNCITAPEDFIQSQAWMGKERSLCSRLYFPFTEPTSWHLMLGHLWGQELTSDPQGCLPYVDLKTCLCVTSFAHTDLTSSPVLQICNVSLILSLL